MKIGLLWLLSLIVSCVPMQNAQNSSGSVSVKTNGDAPYIWFDKSFPKTIKISEDFTPHEFQGISNMGDAWDKALANKVNFFTFSYLYTPPITNLDDLNDNILGVYKLRDWPLYQDALAVTQIYGRRENVGKDNEYVRVVHADIIINYTHSFYTSGDSVSGYHFETVVLHEMGHFLGLLHYYGDRNNSIMYPSVRPGEEKIVPKSLDASNIADKYDISIGSGGLALSTNRIKYVPGDEEDGEDVKILIELKTSGECIHKENGVVRQRHQVKL